MKITKSVNSATNSCGIPAKPSTKIEEASETSYMYITKHGLGPGTLPKDVKLVDSKELSPYLTAIWVDRFLTTEELEDYGIYPETETSEVLEKNGIEETAIMSATYDNSAEQVNEDYIFRVMTKVDEELPDTFVTYKYDADKNLISCTSASPSQIAEYDVPAEDLSGMIDEDAEYILGAIRDFKIDDYDVDDELVEDGRYEFVDTKLVIDSDGMATDYTMYYDTVEDKYVFVFGDIDLYSPYDGEGYFDFECEDKQEAREWLEYYQGPGEDYDDDPYDWPMYNSYNNYSQE